MTDSETAGVADAAPAVDLRGITKSFGAVRACDGVDLVLHRGRIHGILGENGAGKSTLMKILIGLVLPDEGRIEIDGSPQHIDDPIAAAALGIGMVHQHFSLVDALSVWENVALGETGRLDPSSVKRRIGEIGEHYGLEIDPDARVGELTAGSAPAGRDHQVPAARPEHRDLRRAHVGAHARAESQQLFDLVPRGRGGRKVGPWCS